jgi:hypothetical protein
VKIRGFRIELGEIEAKLLEVDGVREAAVLARADAQGDQRLVAYVVMQPEQVFDAGLLRAALARELADYMVPSAFVQLDAMPLTPNGKVDRKAFPAFSFEETQDAYVAPSNAIEAALCDIWREVLDVERVGVTDDFFRIGGNSLKAVRFIAAASKAGLNYSVKTVMERRTIAELARAPRGHAPRQAEQGLILGDVPLSSAQQLFLETTTDQPNWGNVLQFFNVPSVDIPTLRQALLQVATHHDVLRARFVKGEDGWRQHIVAPEEMCVSFEQFDVSDLSDDEQVVAINRLLLAAQGEMNLEHGPLATVKVFYRGAERGYVLRPNVHHLLMDGYSMAIVYEDWFRCYAALLNGETARLPDKTASTRMWIQALADYVNSYRVESEIDYWRSLPWNSVAKIPVEKTADPRQNIADSNVDITMTLSVTQTRHLKRLAAASLGMPLANIVIAALLHTVGGYAKGSWLPIRVLDGGRGFDLGLDASRTVGWLCVQRVLMLHVEQDAHDLLGGIEAVQEQIQAVPNKGFGLELLQCYHRDAALRAELRSLPATELFLNFNDDNGGGTSADAPRPFSDRLDKDEYHCRWIAPLNVNNEKFTCNCYFTGGALNIVWRYSKNLYAEESMAALSQRLFDYLTAVADLAAARFDHQPSSSDVNHE